MRYGKIRIEDGYLAYSRHMMLNSLPCKDIVWAYMRREGEDSPRGSIKQIISNYLVVVTRRKKRYMFDMTEKEVQECLRLLKALNPEMAVGFPRGGRLPFQSLPNTRDLGALTSRDDRHILPRKLLCSGELYHASQADKQLLTEEYRVKTVVDFRSNTERREKPDVILRGVEYYHIPILDEENLGLFGDGRVCNQLLTYQGDGKKYMEQMYDNLIRDRYSVNQYARFLDVLIRHKEGAVLWHSWDGKGRAGVATALLLCALGIPEDTVKEDFMRSNTYMEAELQYMLLYLEAMGMDSPRVAENMSIFFKVKEAYIDRVFQIIRQEYGTIERFLRRGLYLTPRAVEELRDKYLI